MPNRSLLQRLMLAVLITGSLVASSLRAEPLITANVCHRVDTGPGPEHLVYLPDQQRLLISSHDRRRFALTGDIYSYHPASGDMLLLKRQGEPEGLQFRPHGMDVQQRDGHWWLYVISHDREVFSDNHRILAYELIGNVLHFREELTSPLLSAPNDLVIADNGDLYVSIERANGSSIAEMIFLQRKSGIAHYRPGQGWQMATNDLSFANGILLKGGQAYVTQTLGEGINHYRVLPNGRFELIGKIGNLSLLDAVTPGRNGRLLSPAHPSLFQLFWHWRRSNQVSRAVVFEVNPRTGDHLQLFADDGQRISAISQALIVDRTLYLAQLFEPFLLACPLPKLK